jgi:DNA polymerase-4
MSETRCIVHVDMDAFYASVEQRDRPELRGRPLLVGGTGGRGVVAAASYEARAFGARSAMPMRQALRLCPEAVCVRPRMSRYQAESRRIFEVFAEFTPQIEGLSLDEAFLDVTGSLALFGPPAALGRRIKERVLAETGLRASVGIGPNKLVAKIASDLEKPDGLCVLFGDEIRRRLDPLPVRAISGIGPRTTERLEALGVTTVAQLRTARESLLRRALGRHARQMQARAAGQDDRPVAPDRADVSISAEETFDTDIEDRNALVTVLRQQAGEVAGRCRAKGLQAGVVTVKIRRADFATFSRQRRIAPPVSEAGPIARMAAELLDRWLDEHPGAAVRLIGVGVAGLSEANQLGLFETGPGQSQLGEAVASIRARFGDASLRTDYRPEEDDDGIQERRS